MEFPIHAIILLFKHPAEAVSLTTQDHKTQGEEKWVNVPDNATESVTDLHS